METTPTLSAFSLFCKKAESFDCKVEHSPEKIGEIIITNKEGKKSHHKLKQISGIYGAFTFLHSMSSEMAINEIFELIVEDLKSKK